MEDNPQIFSRGVTSPGRCDRKHLQVFQRGLFSLPAADSGENGEWIERFEISSAKCLGRMQQAGEDMNQTGKSAKSKTDFIASSGIGQELADFLDAFVQSPERFIELTVEERRKIEDRMDAVLSSFRS